MTSRVGQNQSVMSRGRWISCLYCVVRHVSYRKRSAGRVGNFPSVMATGRRCLVEHLRYWAQLEYGRFERSFGSLTAVLDRPLTMGRDHHLRVPGGGSILHAPTASHRKWSRSRVWLLEHPEAGDRGRSLGCAVLWAASRASTEARRFSSVAAVFSVASPVPWIG